MKFRINGPGWPIGGGVTVPGGTVFDFDIPEHKAWAQGLIPINATPLDAEAWEAQLAAYPEHLAVGSEQFGNLGEFSPGSTSEPNKHGEVKWR